MRGLPNKTSCFNQGHPLPVIVYYKESLLAAATLRVYKTPPPNEKQHKKGELDTSGAPAKAKVHAT